MPEPDVIAYTDGGCRGNPGGIGGWGLLLIDPRRGKALERRGGDPSTTNNRMELMGAIQALRALRRDGLAIRLHSDSEYVIKGISQWLPGWKARGWRMGGSGKKAPKNLELWQELDALAGRFTMDWRWVRGHAGDRGNEICDQLANAAMDAIRAGADPAYDRWRDWP